MHSPPRRLAVLLSGAAALVAVLAATAVAGVPSQKQVAGQVPTEIRAKGTLVVASDPTYAPNEFMAADGHTIVGMAPDLAQALGKVLGLKVKIVAATFDAIIPGLSSGKYDVGLSSFTDTKAREKVVDFVTYFSAGTSFYVKASGGVNVRTVRDLCGKSVAVEKGTTQQADAEEQGERCNVNVLVFPDQNGANLALASGRAQVVMADSPPAAYAVRQSHGQFRLSGKPYGTAPYGIALPKGNGMAKPVRDALRILVADGRYRAILAKWGLSTGAVATPRVNAAKS